MRYANPVAQAMGSVAMNMFSWNTLESSLLFSALLINLSGICFNAIQTQCEIENNCDFFQPQVNTLLGLVLTLIFSSIIYFFFVLMTEVSYMYQEEMVRRGKMRPDELQTLPEQIMVCCGCADESAQTLIAKQRNSKSSKKGASKRKLVDALGGETGEPADADMSANPIFKRLAEDAESTAASKKDQEDGPLIEDIPDTEGRGVTEAEAQEIRDRAQVVLQLRTPPTGASWEQIKANYVNMSKHIEELARQVRRAGVEGTRGPTSSQDAAAAGARRSRRGVRKAGRGASTDSRKEFGQM